MKTVHLSKNAKEKLDAYRAINLKNRQPVEGFLIGNMIGNIPIVNDLLIIKFDINSIDQIYPLVLESYKNRLLGPFFLGEKKFESEWFLEDIVMEFL